MKKIISFSLWGQNTLYTLGAVKNSEMRKDFYPDWTCRFYVDASVPTEILSKLDNGENEIYRMNPMYDVLGMFWRFRPMFDDAEIERFIVRDCDSRFTMREVNAVKQWEKENTPFHLIRDNQSHNTHILGGMWGAKKNAVPNFEFKINSYLSKVTPCNTQEGRRFHGADQLFLSQYVWPFIKDDHTGHIMAGKPHLRYTGNEIDLPPLEENGHYIGMVC